jgi:Protein of unknown function (DUF2619)
MTLFSVVDKLVYGMAGLRLLSGIIELAGAFLMIWFGTAQKALQVNAALAMTGPTVLVLVTLLGTVSLAGHIPTSRIVFIVIGVGCILFGARGV